jgi:hypothetical protein
MRNILRTVAGVVIFLTGYFYIFGKSNEGCAAEAKSPPIRQELVHEYLVRLRPCHGKDCAEMLTTRGLRIVSTCPCVNKMSTFKC